MRLLILSAFFLLLEGCSILSAATTNVSLTITAPWRYNTNNLQSVNWPASGYDDSAWAGPSNALLYIETSTAIPAPKQTPLPPKPNSGLPLNTYYFRNTFSITNAANVNALVFSNLVDDGAVYYLNGVEIQRLYLPGGPISYNTLATSHEANTWSVFTLTGNGLTNLLEGVNTLAAEVHQTSASSSDIVFGTAVTAIYPSLTRGPYLQCSTPTSIVIRWRTDVATDSRVVYGTSFESLGSSFLNPSLTTEHIVTLTNLQADARYYYAVGTSGGLLAAAETNQFFLTHPLPGTAKPIRVWVIGDAGTKNVNQAAVRDAFYGINGTNLVHAWLQLGDNAYTDGTDAEYQAAVFDMYPTLLRRSVTWPTLGNHDTAQSVADVDTYSYFDIFTLPTGGEAGGVPSVTEHYYSFDLGMVHFVCLDSMTASRATNGAMLNWLRSDLAVTTNRWIIAFWHHPPYTRGSHNSDTELDLGSVRTNFLPILEAGGVDLVLCGHSHCYERSFLINGHTGTGNTFSPTNIIQAGSGRESNGVGAYRKPDGLGESPVGWRGTVYTVAGSSGQATTGTTNHPAMYYSDLALGSVVLDFSSNRLDAIFLRETGAIDDSFTLIKEGTYPPRMADLSLLDNTDLRVAVQTRAYRTNIIEMSSNFTDWTAILTNFTTNATFSFRTPITNAPQQFFRVYRP